MFAVIWLICACTIFGVEYQKTLAYDRETGIGPFINATVWALLFTVVYWIGVLVYTVFV